MRTLCSSKQHLAGPPSSFIELWRAITDTFLTEIQSTFATPSALRFIVCCLGTCWKPLGHVRINFQNFFSLWQNPHLWSAIYDWRGNCLLWNCGVRRALADIYDSIRDLFQLHISNSTIHATVHCLAEILGRRLPAKLSGRSECHSIDFLLFSSLSLHPFGVAHGLSS